MNALHTTVIQLPAAMIFPEATSCTMEKRWEQDMDLGTRSLQINGNG